MTPSDCLPHQVLFSWWPGREQRLMDPSMRRLLGAPGTARFGAKSDDGAEGGSEGGGGVLLLCRCDSYSHFHPLIASDCLR